MIKFFILSLFAMHIGITALYLLPKNPATNYYQDIVKSYMTPIFTQDWRLFSPDPILFDLKLYYRCENTNGRWSTWKDPLANLIKSHQANRFQFKGKLIYVYHGIYRNLLDKKSYIGKKIECEKYEGDCRERRKKALIKLPEYENAQNFVGTLCRKDGASVGYQFKIVKIYPKKFSERNNKDAKEITSVEIDSGEYDAIN